MATYVYKVNANNRVGQHFGDWQDFFSREQPATWGLVEIICRHFRPVVGDRIIAYQTNLKRVIGTAEVVGYKLDRIVLRATEGPFEHGPKVTDLKKQYPRIGQLHAFQQGLVQTLYEIADDDADYLLAQVRNA